MAPIIFWAHECGLGFHMDGRWLFRYEFLGLSAPQPSASC